MAAIDRETSQLLLVARHYITSAKRLVARDRSILGITNQEITDKHDMLSLGRAELLLAHLASASFRLCTVCEKHNQGGFPSYRQFYEGREMRRKKGPIEEEIIEKILANLQKHIHFLLRDNVGHTEGGLDIAKDRDNVLMRLTLAQVLGSLQAAYKHISENV